MNKESIEQRLAELNAMEQQVTQNIQKSQADLSAINGAKQDCAFWLAKIEEAVIEGSKVVEAPIKGKPGRKKKTA